MKLKTSLCTHIGGVMLMRLVYIYKREYDSWFLRIAYKKSLIVLKSSHLKKKPVGDISVSNNIVYYLRDLFCMRFIVYGSYGILILVVHTNSEITIPSNLILFQKC